MIGEALGLDTSTNLSLWQDRVALELNAAVLTSFTKAGVTLVDQHTASEQFDDHFRNEMRERGGCPSDWVWLVPSQSGSLTPLYHQEMLNYHLTPCFERQDLLWESWMKNKHNKRKYKLKSVAIAVQFLINAAKGIKEKPNIRLVFATETGTAKRFTLLLKRSLLKSFNVETLGADEFKEDLLQGFCIFVVATAGEGAPPKMANSMVAFLKEKLASSSKTNAEEAANDTNNNSMDDVANESDFR